MAEILDDSEVRRGLDPQGMLEAIAGLPEQCRQAWTATRSLELPADYSQIDRILVLGMGGSAIAGDMLRSVLQQQSAIPVFSVRQYHLPSYVDERSLVIASSFSGNTEETLSAFDQALTGPAKKFVVTGGGRLLDTARAHALPVFTYEYQGQPRAALGWSLMPLLAVVLRLRLLPGLEHDVEEALDVMADLRGRISEDVPAASNPAKQVARRLHGRLPVIYGAEPLTAAARRWKTQLNENSKVWSFYEELPEANHNAILGYTLPPAITAGTAAVFLQSGLMHPRVRLRYGFTGRTLDGAGVETLVLDAQGEGVLAQILSTVLMGDYVSYYLALLNGVDPVPTRAIDDLKDWLAQQG